MDRPQLAGHAPVGILNVATIAIHGESECVNALIAFKPKLANGDPIEFRDWDDGQDMKTLVAVLIADTVAEPIAVARKSFAQHPLAPVAILRCPEELAACRARLLTSSGIGQDTQVLSATDVPNAAGALQAMAWRGGKRQQFRRRLAAEERSAASPANFELQMKPELVDQLLVNLPIGVIAVDGHQRLLTVNPAAQKISGLHVGQIGEVWTSWLPPAAAARASALVSSVNAGADRMYQVISVAAQDGNKYYYELTVVPAGRSAAPGACLVILQDVTGRLRAEAARARSEQLLAESNRELEHRVLARTEELAEARDSLKAQNSELIAKAEELQRLLGAEAANQAKSHFLATMSHEIRTPLHGLLGLLELHDTSNLRPRQRNDLHMMRCAAEALRGIIDDVLDFSKIEAGHMELDQSRFSLRSVIEETGGSFAASALRKGLRLSVHCDPTIPPLLGDALRIRQVIANLVSNAVKFTGTGYIAVTARLESATSTQAAVRIAVRDSGSGISPEAQERVFERFMQDSSRGDQRTGGTGLGLAICKGLCAQMGGTVTLQSQPGSGSCFEVQLNLPIAGPVEDHTRPQLAGLTVQVSGADDRETEGWMTDLKALGATPVAEAGGSCVHMHAINTTAPDEPRPAVSFVTSNATTDAVVLHRPIILAELARTLTDLRQGTSGQLTAAEQSTPTRLDRATARILVAEDNLVNRTVIEGQLKLLGYAATVVDDGAQADAALSREKFDLLITDIHMPKLDGFELARNIRARELGAGGDEHMPIIALTAGVERSEIDKCYDSGIDQVEGKPMSLEKLRNALNSTLASKAREPLNP